MESVTEIDRSGENIGRRVIDFVRIRTIYPNFQRPCALLSVGFHVAFVVLLSYAGTPFTFLAHHPFMLVVFLSSLWPCFFLFIKLANFLEEHMWIANSTPGGFVRFLIDALITVGLTIGSTYLSNELVGGRHLAGVICLLADITLLELWMLEDRDFCLGDVVFNLASGIALLKFKDRLHAVGVISLFCVRRGFLFAVKQKLLATKNAEMEAARARAVTEREELRRAAAEREVSIREEARVDAARHQEEVVYQMVKKHAVDVAALQEKHAAAMNQAKIEQEDAVTAVLQRGIFSVTELHRLFSAAKLGFEEPEGNEAFMELGRFIRQLNDAPSSSNLDAPSSSNPDTL